MRILWLALAIMVPVMAPAQLTFTTNNGAITITECNAYSTGALIVPNNINGRPVTSIANAAFSQCGKLTGITMGTNIVSIGNEAFIGCESLASIIIPNGVTNIGFGVFTGCASLTNVVIPARVTSIGQDAFLDCFSLRDITIPSSVTNIGIVAFGVCSNLAVINVANGNPVYSSIDGVLFDKNQTTLVEFPFGKVGDYTIPSNVTSIGSYAFYYCSELTNVTMGSELASIGTGAFFHCAGFTSVTIPNSVSNIGDRAFENCFNLTKVLPGTGVVNVGQSAFASCSKLVSVAFTNSLVYIGWYAFESCSGLTNFVIPNSVATLGSSAFEGCSGLTTMTISASVTNMEDSVFFDCPNLTNVYFEGDAPYVYYKVFDGLNDIGYYLPGTTGWTTNFSGLPMVQWLPHMQPMSVALPVPTNQFAFNINWANGKNVVVEACANLAAPVWTPVATNLLSNGTALIRDQNSTNYLNRFYRVRTP